jgi:hypothetical protein
MLSNISQIREETAFKDLITPLEQRRLKYIKKKTEFGSRQDEVRFVEADSILNSICIYNCMQYMYTYVYTYIYVYIYIYIHMYICKHVSMYIHVCRYITGIDREASSIKCDIFYYNYFEIRKITSLIYLHLVNIFYLQLCTDICQIATIYQLYQNK